MRIALVGSAPSSNMLAPYADPSWKIWACSPDNAGKLPRVDTWFEIHGDLGWPETQEWAGPYIAWLNRTTFELYCQDRAIVPRAKVFPKDELIAKYGPFFFTSTFSWMIALALEQGATEIGVWGVDMATDQEYRSQRQGFHHFLHIAMERGVKIVAPDESDILQPAPLYGYAEATAFGRKLAVRRKELERKIDEMRRQRDELNHHITHLSGALDDIDYIQTIWTGHQDHREDARHVERILPVRHGSANGVAHDDDVNSLLGAS